MPIYEFQCEECQHKFDYLARNTADRAKKCPKCGAKKLTKQFSTFSQTLAGSGGASCSLGSCATPTCATGACPFG